MIYRGKRLKSKPFTSQKSLNYINMELVTVNVYISTKI